MSLSLTSNLEKLKINSTLSIRFFVLPARLKARSLEIKASGLPLKSLSFSQTYLVPSVREAQVDVMPMWKYGYSSTRFVAP